jgi:type II secretion system protein H
VRRAAGFTLLELLAVVLLIALLAAVVMPGLGFTAAQALDDQAKVLAADLEFARQRSVMTGVPHRVLLDLDAGGWRVEWEVPDPEAAAAEPPPGLRSRNGLDLRPPRAAELVFRPLPARTGRAFLLEEDVAFDGVETAEGVTQQGTIGVVFGPDGSADPAEIVLREPSGSGVALEVRALADAVVLRDAR